MSTNLHDTIDPHETLSTEEAHEHHAHVTPFWPRVWVFMVLLVLTALTVWSSNIHSFWIGNTLIELGPMAHITIALVIATVKAVLVAMYFMHLKYDTPMNTAVVGATVFGVVLFIGLTLADMGARDVLDRAQHQTIMRGGTSHMVRDDQGRPTFITGMGVVEAARQNAKAAATNPGAEGDGEAAAGEDH
jgi:cytochrome c oxidase subunit 4